MTGNLRRRKPRYVVADFHRRNSFFLSTKKLLILKKDNCVNLNTVQTLSIFRGKEEVAQFWEHCKPAGFYLLNAIQSDYILRSGTTISGSV